MASKRMAELGRGGSAIRALMEYGLRRKAEIGEENVYDYSIGNPSVPTPSSFSQHLIQLIQTTPAEKLHGYTSAAGDWETRKRMAAHLAQAFSIPTDPNLIYMTCGAAASLSIAMHALLEPGEEIVVPAPFFPEYAVFAEKAGGILRPVSSLPGTFQLDLSAMDAAIGPKTRIVLINSPNNPTGVILSEDSLRGLAALLYRKSQEYGQPIYLLSDEPYREIIYDAPLPYPAAFYENTLIAYSFSKALSLPGERIGYLLVHPEAADAKTVFAAISGAARSLGYVCAPALFQYAVRDLPDATADFSTYRKNRDLLYPSLTKLGFDVVYPDGAFYLFLRAPIDDASRFSDLALAHDLLLVPSDSFGLPGYVRLAYCVPEAMIRRSLPAFEALAAEMGLSQA